MGNYSSSPEYNRKFLSYQNLYNSPINNDQNNFSYNFRRKLFEEENKFPINTQNENKNIKKQKNDLSMAEMRKDEIEKNEVTTNNIKKFLLIMVDMVTNVHAQKLNVIDIIVNVLDLDYIVEIVIAKIVKINHLKIALQIDILHLFQINQKQNQLHVPAPKVAVIKSTVNAIKMGVNVILLAGVQGAKILKNAKKVKDEMYECTLANSIYIVHNKMIEEEIVEGNIIESKNLVKKRKRSLSIPK